MISTCTPVQAKQMLAEGNCLAIDVREYAEYASGHVPGAKLIPLGQFRDQINSIDPNLPLLLACKGGKRATQAAQLLEQKSNVNAFVIEGGTDAWIAAGLPVEREAKAPWALERQVRLAAGMLVLIGLFIPPWPWLSAFVGAGLVFAAVSNTCGMGLLLSKLPWNRPAVSCSVDSPCNCGERKSS
ncbi:MAG TPA: rhodanese-like domain-containing protein [Tepidisphaeraceae bacterium]|nr:rhodanese-like domain-containing protein [Tepidisphaeraceae bacterium]